MDNYNNDNTDREETNVENRYLLFDSHMWMYEQQLTKSHSQLIEKYLKSKPNMETVKVEVFGFDSNNNAIFLIKNEDGIEAMSSDTLPHSTVRNLLEAKTADSSVQPVLLPSTTIDLKKEDFPVHNSQQLVLVSGDKANTSVDVVNNNNTSTDIEHSCLNYISFKDNTYVCRKCALTFTLNVKSKENNYLDKKVYPVSFEMLGVLNLIKKEVLRHECRPYQCSVCGKSYKTKKNITIHERIHTGERPYSCDLCHQTFRSKTGLTKHKIIHIDVKPYPCLQCKKAFKRKTDLQIHLQSKSHTADDKLVSCETCGKMVRGSYMNRHILNTHNDERKRHTCHQCGKSFKTNQHLQRHKLIHEEIGQFPCDICHKTFKQKTNLKTHKLSHSEVRNYACMFCDKRFKQRQGLNSHTSSHTKVKDKKKEKKDEKKDKNDEKKEKNDEKKEKNDKKKEKNDEKKEKNDEKKEKNDEKKEKNDEKNKKES